MMARRVQPRASPEIPCVNGYPVTRAGAAQRWLDVHGAVARSWMDAVPDLTYEWSERWGLSALVPLTGGSVSVVIGAEREGIPVVLKLAAPWSEWAEAEATALRAWDGHGAPRLIAAAQDARVLLLERVLPGTPAIGMTPIEVAGLLHKLHRNAAVASLPDAADALRIRFGRAGEDRHHLLGDALADAHQEALGLAHTMKHQAVLAHGDLLSKNVLRDDAGHLVAIDPNPFCGEAEYDVALWALTESPVEHVAARAEALVAHLGLEAERVDGWIDVLAAVEIALAPRQRALDTLELSRRRNVRWLPAQLP